MDTVPFHIGIATSDLEAAKKDLGDLFGVNWTPTVGGDMLFHQPDGTPQRRPISSVSKAGSLQIDLMQGEPGTIWYSDVTKMHHVAYWTDDVAGDVDRLTGEGWTLDLTLPDDQGRPSLFAYLVRPDGFRVEIIDDKGKDDWSKRTSE